MKDLFIVTVICPECRTVVAKTAPGTAVPKVTCKCPQDFRFEWKQRPGVAVGLWDLHSNQPVWFTGPAKRDSTWGIGPGKG